MKRIYARSSSFPLMYVMATPLAFTVCQSTQIVNRITKILTILKNSKYYCSSVSCIISVCFQGAEYISDYAISFHYVTPEEMYLFELFLYQLSVYGEHPGQKDLNRKKN